MNFDFLHQEFLHTPIKSYLIFVGVLLIGFIFKKYLAQLLAHLIQKILKSWGFDYAGEKFKTLLIKPLGGFVWVLFLYIAVEQIHPALKYIKILNRTHKKIINSKELIDKATFSLQDVADNVIILLLIFYFFYLLIQLAEYFFIIFIHKAQLVKDRGKQQILPLLKDVLKVILGIFGFFIIIGYLFKVNIGTLFAGLGVSGIAIAFAAKESLENLIASFMLMMDKTFTIGDWIKVGNIEGSVEKMGFRSTKLMTTNKSVLLVPNKTLMGGNVENLSTSGLRRVKTFITAPPQLHKEELQTLIKTIKESISQIDHVVGEPRVFLDNLDNNTANISVSYTISLTSIHFSEQVREEVNLCIYDHLEKAKQS